MPHRIQCSKLKEELDGLENPPFPGPLGKKIYQHVSQKAWDNWFSLQTMMINEYHLDMHEPKSRDMILNQMEHYFFSNKEGGENP